MLDHYLSEITFSHFRSHLDTKLELSGAPVAIFGLNGVGKTNILEAISMLSPGRGLRRSKLGDMTRSPEAIGWKVSAVLQLDKSAHTIETKTGPNLARLVYIDDKSESQISLGKLLKMIWLTPSMDRLWVEGAEMRRRFLDRITHSFIPGHAEAVLSYEKSMKERNTLLKEFNRDPDWYSAVEDQMASSGVKINENRNFAVEKLISSMKNVSTSFPVASLDLINYQKDFTSITVDGFKELLSSARSDDFFSHRTSVGPHKTDLVVKYQEKGLDAKNCSTGEQKALLISLILANARALINEFNISPIILLDEVAAHLDADRRKDLYAEIRSLNTQAWMTGTGAELFDEIGSEAQKFEVTYKNGTSRVISL
ncbi:MAG: DNA replication/repair protein RecF [Paracoccaceae bacterium]